MVSDHDIEKSAMQWFVDHKEHIRSLVDGYEKRVLFPKYYKPFGADLLRPELWKVQHWLWFMIRQDLRFDEASDQRSEHQSENTP